MLEFTHDSQKEWTINYNEFIPVKITLVPSTIERKFFIVSTFLQNLSQECVGFSEWFMNWLHNCKDPDKRPKEVVDNIDTIKNYVNQYLQKKDIDYNSFVDETKIKKNSIFFSGDEIAKISRVSCYLKIYSIIYNTEEFRLGLRLHKDIYNRFVEDFAGTTIVRKIFNIVKTRTFRYNQTDKFMWDYIKTVQCKDIGTHVVEIFNFIMNQILVICEENRNPISYFVGVIDESLKWFLRAVYKGSIVYEDTISTEDIQGINVDNLKTYSYNDTLGRLKGIAFEKVHEMIQKQLLLPTTETYNDKAMVEFNERLRTIAFVSPLSETLVYPILSKALNIPYSYFRTLSPEHASVISAYMYELLRKVFGIDYKYLFALLQYYPTKQPAISTTYKIKSISDYIDIQNELKSFFGFKTMILPHTILCHFIGRMSRVDFCNLLDGRKLGGIPLSKIETDSVSFYSLLFAGKLDQKIREIEKLINQDF